MSTARDGSDGTNASCPIETSLQTYAQQMRTVRGARVDAATAQCGDGLIGVGLYRAPAHEIQMPALPVSRLGVMLTRFRGGGSVRGEPTRGFEASRYATFFVPAGTAVSWRKETPSRHLTVFFRPELLAPIDTADKPLMARSHFNLLVPGIRALADQLVDELVQPALHSALATGSLARLLLVRLSRHLHAQAAASVQFGVQGVAKLREFVMARLREPVRAGEMAGHLGLSIGRFAAACKHHTGKSPHQFVIALRLERACELLRQTALSIAQVAQDCGFSNQQHLTTTMQRHLGTTPRHYRQLEAGA